MEFELEEYHRNTPEERFVEDLRSFATKLDVSTVTQDNYAAHGEFGANTITKRRINEGEPRKTERSEQLSSKRERIDPPTDSRSINWRTRFLVMP